MTYLANKPVVSLSNQERQLITIEFAPNIHPEETEYSYERPLFVFGDRVVLVNSFPEDQYIVCGLELMESKTPSGKLLNQPRWKYKISNGEVSYCKEETALVRCKNQPTKTICANCQHFENFHERERGWCARFDHQARTYQIKTNDCILNSADEPLEAFSTEGVELDRDSYPMMETAPTGYFSPNFTTSPGEPF